MSAFSARDLTVRLGTYEALSQVTFDVGDSAFVAVVGPNGAGKSTLIRTALGLEEVTSGSIQVLGMTPGDSAIGAIGYVPQIKTLDRRFPAEAVELVVSGLMGTWPWRIKPEQRTQAEAALRKTGMEGKSRRLLAELSGGELQRVYLARALVRKPRLIFLDEPATGMDAVGEADMYHMLEHYREDHDATIFMITHDWEVARHHATQVLLLNRRVVGFGNPDEVLTGERLRSAFGHVGHSHPMHVVTP